MKNKQPSFRSTSSSDDTDSDNEVKSSSINFRVRVKGILRNLRKNIHGKVEKDDDVVNESSVGLFKLFHFTNRSDKIMLFFGMCAALAYSACYIVALVLFGRLTGSFALQSSGDRCLSSSQSTEGSPTDIIYELTEQEIVMNTTTSTNQFRTDIRGQIDRLLIMGCVQFTSILLMFLFFEITSRRQIARMSIRLFEIVLQRSIGYFNTKSSGDISSKLLDNIERVRRGIGFNFSLMISILIITVSSIFVCFFIFWQLTSIMLIVAPLIILGSRLSQKLIVREWQKEMKICAQVDQIVQEVFSCLRTVLSLNGAIFEQQRYEKRLQASHWINVRKGVVVGIFVGWLTFTSYCIYGVGFILGSTLLQYGEYRTATVSDVLVVVITFTQGVFWIAAVNPLYQMYVEARGAAKSVFDLIDETENAAILETESMIGTNLSKEPITGDIQFDHVRFTYPSRPKKPVLRDLCLTARAGKTTAIVGLSGSGKSTCVSLLLRFYDSCSGRILMNGRPINQFDVQHLRHNIGVVSQEPILFATTIYENIRYGNQNASKNEIKEAARQANAHNFIMRLPNQYDTLVGERGVQLSGGEKQRVALARALVKNPSLLLLDEATSALDNSSEKIVQKALDRACQGRTTIVIAHRLSTIRNAHQIYVMESGSVVECGTHDALRSKEGGKYRAMIEALQVEANDTVDGLTDEDPGQISEEDRFLIGNAGNNSIPKNSSSSRSRLWIFMTLLSMNRPEKMTILIGCLAAIAGGASQPLASILLARVISALEDCKCNSQRCQVLSYSFLYLLFGLSCMFIRFVQFTAFAISGSKLIQRVCAKVFACLLRQEVAYFDRVENSSGAITARLSTDTSAIRQMTGTRLGVIFETLMMLVLGVILGSLFSWQLTLVVLFFIVCCFLMIAAHVYSETKLAQSSRIIAEKANSLVVEATHNMSTVKQLNIENEFLRQYRSFIDQAFRIIRSSLPVSGIVTGLNWSLSSFMMAVLYARSLDLLENNQLQPENMIKVFAFVTFSMQSLQIIMSMTMDMGALLSSAQSIFDLFDRKPKIDNGSTEGKRLANFRGEIEFDQVTFAYPSRPTSHILHKFQLNLKSGQRVALVGASGCGKSTVIQLMERFYDINRGQLLLDGVDIRELNIHWVRSCLGLVNQEPILFDLTIAENIAYGLENISMNDIIDAAIQANIHQFILTLPMGYATRVGQKGSQLSGGEKQRIAIARCLIRRPRVLILDEATSAMDSHNERVVQQALEQSQRNDPNRTLLIIAHRLSTIRSCDLICVLVDGRVVESGTHMELLGQRGVYHRMLLRNNS